MSAIAKLNVGVSQTGGNRIAVYQRPSVALPLEHVGIKSSPAPLQFMP